MKLPHVAATIALCLALAPVGRAQMAAVNFTGSAKTQFHSGNSAGTLGWQFTVNTNINVTALGFFDANGAAGLTEDHEVGIYNSTGTLLDSTTVNAGTLDPLNGQFRYATITSLPLSAGQTYVIAGTMGATGSDPVTYIVTGLTNIPAITLGSTGLYADGAPFTTLRFPTLIYNPNYAYFGPNFEVSPSSAVPEPGAYALLASLGLTGAAFLRRRQAR